MRDRADAEREMGTSGAGVPHDGAEALAGDGVPALVVRDGVALVGGAAVRAAAAHRLRLGRFSPRSVVGVLVVRVVCVVGTGHASGSAAHFVSLVAGLLGLLNFSGRKMKRP